MRASHLFPLIPALLQAAPPTLPLEEANTQILEAFEEAPSPDGLPTPPVRVQDRLALKWLLAALREDKPRNPFPKGSRHHGEAEALRTLLCTAPVKWHLRLKALPLSLAGSQAALWRRGQALARRGELPKELRHAWEDRLLRKGSSTIIRGWVLRHAFCFALAEADEARFEALKVAFGEEVPELAAQFQRAFALLGGPMPRIYLWSLPALEALDLPLSRLGSRLYIVPLEPGTPPPPEGCAWIVPCMRSNHPVQLSNLEGESLEEARRIAEGIRAQGRKAYLAPSREPFLACALAYFPIEIRLDATGLIKTIRMGDAALAKE